MAEQPLTGIRILVFAPEAYPPASAESIVTSKLLSGLADAGAGLRVISNRFASERYPAGNTVIFPGLGGKIRPLPRPGRHEGSGGRANIIRWCFSAIVNGRKMIRTEKPDLMISRVMPFYGHLPALVISFLYRIPWIAMWSDPTPVTISPPPYGKGMRSNSLQGIITRLITIRATWHAFPNRYLADYMSAFYPAVAPCHSVVPHIAQTSLVTGFRKPEPSRHFTLCHQGGLGLRSPETFLKAVILFLGKHPGAPLRLQFVGPPEEELIRMVRESGLGHAVEFKDAVPYSESLEMLNTADVAVLIEADLETGLFLPSKVADFIQAGLPILSVSPKKGVMADLLRSCGGVAADRKDPQEISQAIGRLYQAWASGSLREQYGSSPLQHEFSPETVTGNFAVNIKTILAEDRHR